MPVSVKVPRWQEEITSFNEAFNRLYDTKQFSNGLIKLKDRKFKVHISVLAARSPVFEELFLNSNSNELEIDDVTEDGLENLLKYIYTDQIGDLDISQLQQTLRAAVTYKQEALIEKCNTLLSGYTVNVDNVIELLNEASDIPAVYDNCVKFLKNNTSAVLQSENFLKATTKTVKTMFHIGLFENVAPMLVVENIIRWARNRLSNKTLFRKELLETGIMGMLPFSKLTSVQLLTVKDTYQGLFETDEALLLYENAISPGSGKPLPKW